MATTVTIYVIDACALIAYLRGELGGEKLRALFKEKNKKSFMHAVNLGEVYYDMLRVEGSPKAEEVFTDVDNLPIELVWTLDIPFLELVGKYKTSYRISYADSYVLALAEREKGIIVSTDHGEFDPVESDGLLSFFWLR